MKKYIYKEIYKILKKLEKKVRAGDFYTDDLKKIKKLTKILLILEDKNTPIEIAVLRTINNTKINGAIYLSKRFENIKNYFFVLSYLDFIIHNNLFLTFYKFIPQLKKFDIFLADVVKNDINNLEQDIDNLS